MRQLRLLSHCCMVWNSFASYLLSPLALHMESVRLSLDRLPACVKFQNCWLKQSHHSELLVFPPSQVESSVCEDINTHKVLFLA